MLTAVPRLAGTSPSAGVQYPPAVMKLHYYYRFIPRGGEKRVWEKGRGEKKEKGRKRWAFCGWKAGVGRGRQNMGRLWNRHRRDLKALLVCLVTIKLLNIVPLCFSCK